ncbi:MAG: tyrosinase family protein [Burkholderiales bacterium]|nr:tyrosinase family protein [Burkholderiales bacterium]
MSHSAFPKVYSFLGSLFLLGMLSGNALSQTSNAPEIKYRKNIDNLDDEELKAFEHAVKMMKIKSARNIYDRTGFLWQAWVHNCTSIAANDTRQFPLGSGNDQQLYNTIQAQLNMGDTIDDTSKNPFNTCRFESLVKGGGKVVNENPGMCEHRKDTFFQWHRAEFYFYEKALQDADPEGLYGPSTKNVTIPYWNFTKPPTGVRFPKAFENSESPLWFKHRAVNTPENNPGTIGYTSPYLLAKLIYKDDWPSFGGYPTSGAGNIGSFESQIHDYMHDEYVGGYLRTPPTAGLDPLFYSFHSFIDYIWEKWIEEHGTETITSGNFFMRGEQDVRFTPPPGFQEGTGKKREQFSDYLKNMGRAELYYDTKKLGYAYHVQALNGKKALLDLARDASNDDYSFQADIYFHPQNVSAEIGKKSFRNRYLIASVNYWALGAHGAHDHAEMSVTPSLKLTQDVSRDIGNLRSGGKDGQEWVITVGISSSDNASGKYNFNAPAIRYTGP